MNRERLCGVCNTVSRIGLYGLFFFTPASNTFAEIFCAIACVGFVVKKIVAPDFTRYLRAPVMFLAVFFVCMGLSLFASGPYFEKSFIALFIKWGKFLLLPFVVCECSRKKDIYRYVFIFLFSALLVAMSGMTQYFWGVEFLRGRTIVATNQVARGMTSCFRYYNSLGAYLLLPFSLCMALLVVSQSVQKKVKLAVAGLCLMFCFCLLHTYSRGAWLGAFGAFFFMGCVTRRRWVVAGLVIGAAVIFMASPLLQERLLFTFERGGDSDRWTYWHVAFRMIGESPFIGKGLGTFMDYFTRYAPPNVNISYAHNCFLQIAAESGIISLLAFLCFVVVVVWGGVRAYIRTQDPVLIGCVCGLVGFLVHSCFETHLYSLPLATLFWLWIGLVMYFDQTKEVNERSSCG